MNRRSFIGGIVAACCAPLAMFRRHKKSDEEIAIERLKSLKFCEPAKFYNAGVLGNFGPKFRMTPSKQAEFVDLFGPSIYKKS